MGYRTERRLRRTRRSVGRSGGRVLLSFAKTFSAEQKDLGVFYQPVGDGGGDGGVVKNSAPLGERGIGGDQRAPLVGVAGRDHLVEKVGGVLIEGQISQLVNKC
jgi:hypothetical protein